MIYLDASALLALLLDEPAAQDVESLLREGDLYITSANYAEVIDQATRVQEKGIAELTQALDPLVAKEILRIGSISPDRTPRWRVALPALRPEDVCGLARRRHPCGRGESQPGRCGHIRSMRR